MDEKHENMCSDDSNMQKHLLAVISPYATFTAGITEIGFLSLICDTDNSFNDKVKRTLFYKAQNTVEDPPGHRRRSRILPEIMLNSDAIKLRKVR